MEPELAGDFPELGLVHAPVEARPRKSPREVKQRLRALADRYTGGKVIHMRQDPVPWAYRVFSRQVGIDPDTDRTPVERDGLERLRHGGLRSENLRRRRAHDRHRRDRRAGDRPRRRPRGRRARACGWRAAGERLGRRRPLSARQLVVADEERPLAIVLGEVAHDAGRDARTPSA